MKKEKRSFGRVISLLLALMLTVSVCVVGMVPAGAADVTSTEKTYDIAIVYDNSGSMYMPDPSIGMEGNEWSKARYAMEIFGSMLDFKTDRLTIFPMWEVTEDNKVSYTPGKESTQPVVIESLKDIDKISKMYTPCPYGTPFTPVDKAYEYLSKSTKDEKWLVVLTDGVFNGEPNKTQLKSMLSAKTKNGIKLQYLGFGGAMSLEEDQAGGFYVPQSKTVEEKLVEACNIIFQRSVLPAKYLKGKDLTVDLSMKKVIVFVQGKGATVNGLTDASGKAIPKLVDSGQRKFSSDEYAHGRKDVLQQFGIINDKSLYGQVVTFDACAKGEYTLDYTGDEKAVQIFYEPDVDIQVSMLNQDGVEVTKAEDFYAGEYTVTSKITDKSTGEDVTNHELMGKDVNIKNYVKTSKDASPKEYENGAKIVFEPDDNTEIWIEGTYLGKYKISTKDDPNWAWLCNLKIEEEKIKLAVEADVQQSGSWYTISDKDNWKPILVKLTLEGQPLTDDQLARTTLTVAPDPSINYRVEMLPGQSAYNVYVGQDGNGGFVQPETGGYDMTFNAVYTDEYGEPIEGKSEASFDVQKYAKWVKIASWILIFLVLFVIWLMFMLKKVLPKKIEKDTARFTTMSSGELDGNFVTVEYRRKGKSLNVAGSQAVDISEQCSATFSLRAVDNRFTPSKRRRVAVIGIDSTCEELKLGGTPYVNYNGQWMKKTELKKAEKGQIVAPVDQELACGTRFELSRAGGVATLTCKVKTTK